MLASTIVLGTWIDHVARCTIRGKLIARSTATHTRDTGKATGVLTATIVNGTWIGGQARVTIWHQIVAWIARASVRTNVVVAYVLAVSVAVKALIFVDARSSIGVDLESTRAQALSHIVIGDLASKLTPCLDTRITSTICEEETNGKDIK